MTGDRIRGDAKGLRVLIVEHDAGVRRLLSEVLVALGEVVAVADGSQVPEHVTFDVAVVDDQQDLDTVAVGVPLILTTTRPANLPDDPAFDLRPRGANARVVEKPFSPHTLLDLVRTATQRLSCFA